ncbi:MAG TPA: inorganic phosphate transporter [Flavisolibacter sp.]|nr:inorganic phosphate transporter [Flavisolibacter sp.]
MTFIIVIIALALIFDYINGFHDAANSIATIVSTKVLTPFQAVVWAAIFNFAAFFIFKDHGVADTVSKTVHSDELAKNTMLIVVFSGLIAAIAWNLLTWWFGIPSSSSHTLIGGFAGAGIAAGGFSVVNSDVILRTASFIFLAPLVGMAMAFIISLWFLFSFRKDILPRIVSLLFVGGILLFLYSTIKTNRADISGIKSTTENGQMHIADVSTSSPAQRMGFKDGDILLTANNQVVTDKNVLDEVLKNTGKDKTFSYTVLRKGDTVSQTSPYITNYSSRFSQVVFFGENFKWLLLGFIILVMAAFTFWLNTLNAHRSNVWFKRLQLVSSAAFSIGHGGNDAQKVMGIIMAALIAHDPATYSMEHMPAWVPLACYTAIGLGTMSGGWKIVKTMGTRITKVTPFEGVAAETAGAITLFVTEALKIPVSTTHTITGAIMGVGATKRLSAVRWGVTINLLWAWILTIPISALLAVGIFHLTRLFF